MDNHNKLPLSGGKAGVSRRFLSGIAAVTSLKTLVECIVDDKPYIGAGGGLFYASLLVRGHLQVSSICRNIPYEVF